MRSHPQDALGDDVMCRFLKVDMSRNWLNLFGALERDAAAEKRFPVFILLQKFPPRAYTLAPFDAEALRQLVAVAERYAQRVKQGDPERKVES